MLRSLLLPCVLMLSAFAQPAVLPLTVQTTAMVGIADGQTARLNLLNPGVLAPALGVICTARISFLDADGNLLKSTEVSVIPGRSAAFDLRSDADLSLAAGDRTQIRATISLPSPVGPLGGGVTTTPIAIVACTLIPTLEVFDTASGRTTVTLTSVTNVR
jgi:hydroxymethylglutaryl-CoA reductase